MTWPAASVLALGALYTTLAVVGTYFLLLVVLLLAAMLRARSARARKAASAELRPVLQSALVAILAGGTDESVFQRYIKTHRTDVAETIQRFQTTVGGSARDRLCELALSLGLVNSWYAEGRSRDLLRRRAAFANLSFACIYEPCRRVAADLLLDGLKDTDEEVRLSSCRVLVLTGDENHIEDLFALAIRPNLLTRVVLTGHLRQHALALAAGPVRTALRSGEAAKIRATLEILVAWERAVPVENLREFLDHFDREIRLLALRLASWVSINLEDRLALIRSLRDEDAGIRRLAAIAVGRQKLTEAIPDLAYCLRREGLELARHAAASLAAMPPQGWRTLEELSASTTPATALAAGEALARARMEQ